MAQRYFGFIRTALRYNPTQRSLNLPPASEEHWVAFEELYRAAMKDAKCPSRN